MVSSTKYSLTTQAVFLFGARLVQILFQFIVPIILVRLLSMDEYGIYQKVIFIGVFISPILRFHIPESLFYFYSIKEKEKDRKLLLTQTYLQLLLIGLVFATIALFGLPILYEFGFEIELLTFAYSIIAIVFFTVTSSILDNIFIIEKKSKLLITFSTLDKIVRTFLLLSLILLYKNINAALLALVLHGFVRFLFLTVYLYLNYGLSFKEISLSKLKEQWKYVLPMGLGILVGVVGSNADRLLLAWLLTNKDFALYSIGNLSIPIIAEFYVSIGDIIMTELSKLSVTNDKIEAIELYKKMILKNAILTIPIVAYFIIVAENIFIFLFTPEYLQSVNVFRVFILTFLFQMLGYGYLLRAFGNTKSIFTAKLIKTLFSLLAGYLLVKHFGIIGAALTYFGAYGINAFYQLYKAKVLFELKWRDYLPWRDFLNLFLCTILPGIVIFALKHLQLESLYYLTLSGLIYFSFIYMFFKKWNYIKIFGFDRVISNLNIMKR